MRVIQNNSENCQAMRRLTVRCMTRKVHMVMKTVEDEKLSTKFVRNFIGDACKSINILCDMPQTEDVQCKHKNTITSKFLNI
jgi:hypothetical protein